MNTGFFTIYWRDMIRFFRFKTLLISSLLQPVLWMAFFGIAMSSSFDRLDMGIPPVPGFEQIGYLTFMSAGVIAMVTLFTSLFGGMSLVFDKQFGLMREILSSPLPRNHLILGIGFSGVTKSWIQVLIIMVFGAIIGVQFFPGYPPAEMVWGMLGILAFVGAFALGFLFLSAFLSIAVENPETLQALVTLLIMPLFFTSNALYPTNAFPGPLQLLGIINPLTYLVTGVRYFAIGDQFMAMGAQFAYTPAEIVMSFLFLFGFCVISFVLALWKFNQTEIT